MQVMGTFMNPPLWLASGSPTRRELLARLQQPCQWLAPEFDERRLPGEPAEDYVQRLALGKARAVRERLGDAHAVVIGADQVCAHEDGRIFGKPGTPQAAQAMLEALSGQTVQFLTGVAVLGPEGEEVRLHAVTARYRHLDAGTISRYLAAEQPWGMAAALRSEGLGLLLLEELRNDDPSAILGLPLLTLALLLRRQGLDLP